MTNDFNTNLTRQEIEQILDSKNDQDVANMLLSISFYNDDWQWVQERCLKLIDHPHVDIQGLAITCLGHIARIHGTIDKDKILPILVDKLKDPLLSGRVGDTLNDIQRFTS